MYESQCDNLLRYKDDFDHLVKEVEDRWREKLSAKDREIRNWKSTAKALEQKQDQLKQELKGMQAEIDLLTNQIDLSEIVSEQNFMPSDRVLPQGDLLTAIEHLAKDIGYNFESDLHPGEILFSPEEAVVIVNKASNKIRELRELIENLSK